MVIRECVTLNRGVGLSPVVASFFHPSMLLEVKFSSSGAVDEERLLSSESLITVVASSPYDMYEQQ